MASEYRRPSAPQSNVEDAIPRPPLCEVSCHLGRSGRAAARWPRARQPGASPGRTGESPRGGYCPWWCRGGAPLVVPGGCTLLGAFSAGLTVGSFGGGAGCCGREAGDWACDVGAGLSVASSPSPPPPAGAAFGAAREPALFRAAPSSATGGPVGVSTSRKSSCESSPSGPTSYSTILLG